MSAPAIEGRRKRFRRILVALDAGDEALRALTLAADLAQSLEAEVAALFVEDRELLRLGELPSFEEIDLSGVRHRRLDRPTIKRELRFQARWVEARLAGLAARRQLRWSFQVVRGHLMEALRQAAAPEDLISLGPLAGARHLPRRSGGCFRLGAGLPAFLAVSARDRWAKGPLAVLLDGSPCAAQALALAAKLAVARDQRLLLLAWAQSREEAERLLLAARAALPESLKVTGARLLGAGPEGRLQALMEQRPGLLVVPACIDLDAAQLDRAHQALAAPLLVMAES